MTTTRLLNCFDGISRPTASTLHSAMEASIKEDIILASDYVEFRYGFPWSMAELTRSAHAFISELKDHLPVSKELIDDPIEMYAGYAVGLSVGQLKAIFRKNALSTIAELEKAKSMPELVYLVSTIDTEELMRADESVNVKLNKREFEDEEALSFDSDSWTENPGISEVGDDEWSIIKKAYHAVQLGVDTGSLESGGGELGAYSNDVAALKKWNIQVAEDLNYHAVQSSYSQILVVCMYRMSDSQIDEEIEKLTLDC
ncbi:hypothetical protein AB4254_10870 [Vibrio breoganii]